MNPTSLEYIYQIAPPVPDRAPTTSRADDDPTGFDNHLSQAASTVFDGARSPNRPAARPSYSPAPSPRRDNDDTTPSESATRPTTSKPPQKDESTNDSSGPANRTQANDKPSSTSRDEHDRDDKRDQDKSDDAPVAAAAGAQHPTAKDASAPPADAAQQAEQGAADQAKVKIAADELSKVPTAATNTRSAVDTKATEKTDESTAELKAGIDVAKADQVAATASKDVAIAAPDKGDDSSKTTKTSARSAKANAAAAKEASQNAKQGSKPDQSVTATLDTTTGAAAIAPATSQAIADVSQLADESKATPKTPAASEPDHSHKDTASDDAQTATSAAPSAPNATTAVANVTVPTLVDATADKPKQSDTDAAKPIAAKTDSTLGTLGRSLRTDLTDSSKTSSSSETSPVDVARFVSRVAKAVQSASDRDGVVQLRLSPPELGSLKIQLTVKDGVMSAALEADNSNARRMLLDHLPALRDRLADQNIRVDRFDVDVKQENNGSPSNPRGFNQNPYQQQTQDNEAHRTAAKTAQGSEAAPAETSVVAARSTSTGINLVI